MGHRIITMSFALVSMGCGVTFDKMADAGGGGGGAATGGSAAVTTTGGMGGTPAMGGGGQQAQAGGGGASPTPCRGTVEHIATVADCIDTTAPDPDVCEVEDGTEHMVIDTSFNSGNGMPRHGFVKFELGELIVGATALELHMTIADAAAASGDQTGVLWGVTPFDRASLFTTEPSNVGGTPLGPDQGSVTQGDVVVWPLDLGLLASTDLHFGVRPTTTGGIYYWNLNGAQPPKLVVTCN